jgi:hypothetical protein
MQTGANYVWRRVVHNSDTVPKRAARPVRLVTRQDYAQDWHGAVSS